MNPLQACKTTAKEMKDLLKDHPDNKWLKKWQKRLSGAVAETKKKGYSAAFERFWDAYPRTKGTSKTGAYGNWCKTVVSAGVDEEMVIEAAKAYARDVKGYEAAKIAHPQTWLSEDNKRWESYENVAKRFSDKTCFICKSKTHSLRNIAFYIVGDRIDSCSEGVCDECKKYHWWYYIKETKTWTKDFHNRSVTLTQAKPEELCREGAGDTTDNSTSGSLSEDLNSPLGGASASPISKRYNELKEWDSKRFGGKNGL